MTEMLARDKAQLDKVGYYHPDFTRVEVPGSEHYIPLGTYINKGLTSVCSMFTYDFAVHGGAITPDIALGTLPAGAIVVGVLTDVLSAVTTSDLVNVPAFGLKVGTTAVASILDATALSGVAIQTATPVKTANTSAVALNIDTAVVSAGKVRFIVQYVMA